MGWIPLIEERALRENSRTRVSPQGIGILLIRKTETEIYAVADKCGHMACPLTAGNLEGYLLECPCHAWRYDIRTGKMPDVPEIGIRVYPARVMGGNICIRLEDGG